MEQVKIRPKLGTSYGRFAASRAAVLLQHLLVLDDFWTAELKQANGRGPLNEDDVQVLGRLVGAMERGLVVVREPLEEVWLMLNDSSDELIEQRFQEIAKAPGAPPGLRDLLAHLAEYELRGAALTGCVYLQKKARSEADLLRSKLAMIVEGGEVPPGDFLIPFRCAALIALVGAGVVSTVGLGGPVGLVAMGAVSQVGLGAIGWVEAKCEVQVPKISFGRRG